MQRSSAGREGPKRAASSPSHWPGDLQEGAGPHDAERLSAAQLLLRWPKADISVTNAGIGGETVLATVARLEKDTARKIMRPA